MSRSPSRRVALYSHDGMGLGHLRRNLAIAGAIVESDPESSALVVAGAHEANAFPLPPRCELLTLPALRKDAAGRYGARRGAMSLRRLTETRAAAIEGAIDAFSPGVLLVDKWPCGALRELEPLLGRLRSREGVRCVLGLRDVLDEPATVEHEWKRDGHDRALGRYFDAVWVYGDPEVFDATVQYPVLAPYRNRIRFTGYLGCAKKDNEEEVRALRTRLRGMTDRIALCLVGGGQDGGELARSFLASVPPSDMTSILVTGPFLPRDTRRELENSTKRRPRTHLLRFSRAIGALIRRADRIISMGGYNTVCEILAAGKHPLLVPRVAPRSEQWIRAERMRHAGAVDAIHPDELHPGLLSKWLAADPPPTTPSAIDLGGMQRIPELLREVVLQSRAVECEG